MNYLDRILLWDILVPRDIDYFRMPVYDHFRCRAYHTQTVEKEWNAKKMAEDLGAELLRSHICFDPDRKANNRQRVHRLLFRFAEDVFCYMEDDELTVYAATRKEALEHAERVTNKYAKEKPAEQPGYYLLKTNCSSIDAVCVKIKHPFVMNDADLGLHYGLDAVEFEQKLIGSLREHTGGTSVFRGEPGTGKTSFIRHLMAKLLLTHRVYYLPMNPERYLASSDLVEFWLHQGRSAPNLKKVIVMEDAEELLMRRSTDNRSKVSSLLNITDGLLGEFLEMHIICTVNCTIDQLDPAIVRQGRLVARREFKRLDYIQAHRLAAAKGLNLPEQTDYSLAEIYRKPVIGGEPTKRKPVGFVP